MDKRSLKIKTFNENNDYNVLNGVFNPEYLLVKNMIDISSKSIPSAMKYSSTELHERIHWFQHAATTWGNYCLILNQSIVETFNNTAYYSDINKILNDFKKIQLDCNSYPLQNQSFNKVSITFKKNILDKFMARNFINFGCSNDREIKRSVDGLTYARSDIYIEINYLKHNDFECSLEELDNMHRFEKYNIYYLNGEILQIKNLLECQARTNDTYYRLATLQYGSDKNDLQIYNNELYWLAFKHYAHFSELDIEDVIKNKLHIEIPKFNAIVDISLNPPIFPFHIETQLQWDDFYPIQRFMKLCICNRNFHDYVIEDNLSHDNYIDLLCKALNWLSPTDISKEYVNKIDSRIIDFEECWENDLNSINNFTPYDYFQYLFYKFSKLRIHSSSLIPNFGFNSSNLDAIRLVAELEIDKNNYWYSCPMKMHEGNENLFTTINEKQYSWLIIELLKSNIIRRNILNLSKKSFPFILKPAFKEYLIELFMNLYGIELNEYWIE